MPRHLRFLGPVAIASAALAQNVQLPPDLPPEIRQQLLQQMANQGVAPGQLTVAPSTQPTTQPADPKQALAAKIQQLQLSRQPQAVITAAASQPAADMDPAAKFEADVLAGRWAEVDKALVDLGEAHAPAVYKHLLRALSGGGMPMQMQQGMPQRSSMVMPAGVTTRTISVAGGVMTTSTVAGVQRATTSRAMPQQMMMPGGAQPPFVTPADAMAILAICPVAPDEETVKLLGQLMAAATRTASFEPTLSRLKQGTKFFGLEEPNRARTAELLFAAGRIIEAGDFLSPLADAKAKKDAAALDQHARHQEALSGDPKKPEALAEAWALNQLILSIDSSDAKWRDAALQRSLALLPRLNQEQADAWLRDSFAGVAKQGWSALAQAAGAVVPPTPQVDPESRRRVLEQNQRLADSILSARAEDRATFAVALNVLANAWMTEAEVTRSRPPMPRMNRNMYGNNVVYINGMPYDPYAAQQMQQQDPNQPQPIPAEALRKVAPADAWIDSIDLATALRLRSLIGSIHLLADDVNAAVPIVEALAVTDPKIAEALANELLAAWARVANPNANQNNPYQNQMVYYSGYMSSPQGIPLTRAQQVKNLAELKSILDRLRKLEQVKLQEQLIAAAFTQAHSNAEVFRAEDVEAIFGPAAAMSNESLESIAAAMRQRLATQWRSLQTQSQNKTNRNDKDLNAEIRRGYEVIDSIVSGRLTTDPENWKLLTLRGAALFDLAEFDYGKGEPLAVYTRRRDAAFESFRKAHEAYAAKVESLKEEDRNAFIYRQWFSAALGASDLGYLTRQSQPQPGVIEQIKAALASLPGDQATAHLKLFAKSLDESIQQLRPEIKQRFLRAGLMVVGDLDEAKETRKLVAYYEQLLGEVQLHVEVDGPSTVGAGKPFGLIIGMRHSEAVGRESGGFARLLMNQNQMNRYYYNPGGQPPPNHRDEIEKRIRAALVDRFDIVSVSFADEKVEPRGFGRPGWRFTPLAYAMVKAKDAAVDRVPAVALDIDFFDSTGQVIMPIESQVVLIDARETAPRPASKLLVTQTLDQREAANGKLSLDVKATARGVIPEIDKLLDVGVTGFKVDHVDDQGLTVARFDVESDDLAAECERTWLITLSAPPDAAAPASFRYPTARAEGTEMAYKRYADADVQDVDAAVAVSGLPLRDVRWWPWALGGAGVVAALAWGLSRLLRPKKVSAGPIDAFRLPATVTPFTIVQLLRRISGDAGTRLSAEKKRELDAAIAALEHQHFAPAANGNGNGDLLATAERWVMHANRG